MASPGKWLMLTIYCEPSLPSAQAIVWSTDRKQAMAVRCDGRLWADPEGACGCLTREA